MVATPVLCEVDPETFCMNVESVSRCITTKTKAIMPVHLYGQSADMTSLCKRCRSKKHQSYRGCSTGVGVKYKNQHVGTFGDLGVLSFMVTKQLLMVKVVSSSQMIKN